MPTLNLPVGSPSGSYRSTFSTAPSPDKFSLEAVVWAEGHVSPLTIIDDAKPHG